MRKASLLVVAAIGLVLVPQAGAHAEITPARVPANGESEFVLSVEGEENAPTVKVAMQLPAGMPNVKAVSVPGWNSQMAGRVITWTGGRIPQGESGEFTDQGPVPEHAGRTAAVSDRSDLRQRDDRPLDRRPVLGHACSDHSPDRCRPATASPPHLRLHLRSPRRPLRATTTTTTGQRAGWSVA